MTIELAIPRLTYAFQKGKHILSNDAEKSPMSHIVLYAHNNTCTTKRKDLIENTNVVLAKYPVKVKLEYFHNSKVPELGSIMRTCSLRVFGFL